MANLQVLDGASASKYLKTSGAGSIGDPHIPEHLESNSAAIAASLTALDNAISGSELQIDVVTSALPTGASTLAEQETQTTSLAAIATSTGLLDNAIAGNEVQTDIVAIAVPTTIYSGQKNVTTAGTAVSLASSQAILSGVTIKAKSINTGFIYVGVTGVTSSTGYILDASETVFLEVANLSTIFIDSSVNGEGVSYIAS